jgi:hypothetical protein
VCIVGMVVPYTVRLAIPHCSSCVDTANRRRLGSTGPFAIFLAFSISIVLAIVGIATERNRWTRASFVVGPLVGLALIIAWSRRRRPGAAQTTAFQAVRVSRLDLDCSGVPRGAVLSFANSTYGDRFLALNPTGPVGPS